MATQFFFKFWHSCNRHWKYRFPVHSHRRDAARFSTHRFPIDSNLLCCKINVTETLVSLLLVKVLIHRWREKRCCFCDFYTMCVYRLNVIYMFLISPEAFWNILLLMFLSMLLERCLANRTLLVQCGKQCSSKLAEPTDSRNPISNGSQCPISSCTDFSTFESESLLETTKVQNASGTGYGDMTICSTKHCPCYRLSLSYKIGFSKTYECHKADVLARCCYSVVERIAEKTFWDLSTRFWRRWVHAKF